jgi:hypothetical protein
MINTVVVVIIIIIIIIIFDSVVGIVVVIWDGRRRNFGLISASVEGFFFTPKRPSGFQVHPSSYSNDGASYKVAAACIWIIIPTRRKVKNEWRCKPSPLHIIYHGQGQRYFFL